ncbi:hypothetical protein Dimus_034793 [Dionaea muscipula]
MQHSSSSGGVGANAGIVADRKPLSEVVTECVRRWFLDTLKEARTGDVNMQVLVGQMYSSGYGVAKDEQKVFTCFLALCSFIVSVYELQIGDGKC